MAEKIKYTRKDLKGPDELITLFSRMMSWVRGNLVKVGIAAGAVTLVLAVLLGSRAYFAWQESKATRDLWPHLNRAREYLEAPAQADAEKLARLEQFLASHVRMHPGTRAAVYAKYYLGSIAYLRGDYGSSAERFRQAIADGPGQGIMEYLLRQGLAQALEAKGDLEGARAAYKDAADRSTNELRVQALESEARTLELLGRKQEAADIYRRILAETPDTPEKEFLQVRLQRLG